MPGPCCLFGRATPMASSWEFHTGAEPRRSLCHARYERRTGPNTRGVSNPASHWDLIGGALQKALGIPEILLQVALQKASAEQRDTRVPPASIKGWRGRCRALASSGSGDGVVCVSPCPLEPRQQRCHKLNYRKPMEATAVVSSFW